MRTVFWGGNQKDRDQLDHLGVQEYMEANTKMDLQEIECV